MLAYLHSFVNCLFNHSIFLLSKIDYSCTKLMLSGSTPPYPGCNRGKVEDLVVGIPEVKNYNDLGASRNIENIYEYTSIYIYVSVFITFCNVYYIYMIRYGL